LLKFNGGTLSMIEPLLEQFGRLLWDYFGPMVSLSFLLFLSVVGNLFSISIPSY